VLKPGGRISTSDVVAIAEISQGLRDDFGMIASCIGGAEHVDSIKAMLLAVGFSDIRLYPKDNSAEIVNSWLPEGRLDSYIASYVMEAVKPGCCCAGGCCC
jgi:5,10-methenyltetrahydromethanopterin hydrogenase